MAKHWMRLDPSRTKTLRQKFMRDAGRRFRQLNRAVWELVAKDDAFALEEKKETSLIRMAERRRYQFLTSPQKLKQFQSWLQQQIDAKVLEVNLPAGQSPWTATYVESAWRKGMMRSYTDVHKDTLAVTPSWYQGTKEQFVQSAFMQPEMMSKVELLATRSFENMKGVTQTVSSQLSRILADGMAHGKGPYAVAREMRKSIGSLTKRRAMTIARTEIIHAHAEGQLDGYTLLGVEDVTAEVEWSTAGDVLVCELCEGMEGETYKVEDAHGLIPLHPNCRCAWTPAAIIGKKK